MAARKSINLLPGVFRTDVNDKFLSATLDQLVSEPVTSLKILPIDKIINLNLQQLLKTHKAILLSLLAILISLTR